VLLGKASSRLGSVRNIAITSAAMLALVCFQACASVGQHAPRTARFEEVEYDVYDLSLICATETAAFLRRRQERLHQLSLLVGEVARVGFSQHARENAPIVCDFSR
jgi:hypothetical protein